MQMIYSAFKTGSHLTSIWEKLNKHPARISAHCLKFDISTPGTNSIYGISYSLI